MIKKYNEFIDESFLDKSKIKLWCLRYGIKNYTVNSNLSIDVDGWVNLTDKNLNSLPIKFNRVAGNFDIAFNNLTSLEGCPNHVYGYFNCSHNKLTTLKGCTEFIDNGIQFKNNNIYSLDGSPKKIGWIPQKYTYAENPVQEILEIFDTNNAESGTAPGIAKKYNMIWKAIECWDTFSPVYEKNGKWYVVEYRLKELYYYVAGKEFEKNKFVLDSEGRYYKFSKNPGYPSDRGEWIKIKEFEFKNYIIDKS